MKRLPLMLIMSFALALGGCQQDDATDVDTTVPEDEPSAVTGYRGELEETEEPDADVIVVEPEDRTTQPKLDAPEQQPDATRPPAQAQPTQDPAEPVDDEPAVEEVPAEDLPADVETDSPQEGAGGGS